MNKNTPFALYQASFNAMAAGKGDKKDELIVHLWTQCHGLIGERMEAEGAVTTLQENCRDLQHSLDLQCSRNTTDDVKLTDTLNRFMLTRREGDISHA